MIYPKIFKRIKKCILYIYIYIYIYIYGITSAYIFFSKSNQWLAFKYLTQNEIQGSDRDKERGKEDFQ